LAADLEGNRLRCVAFQEEVTPTTEKEHIQGFIVSENAITLAGVKKLLKRNDAHIEAMRGSVASNLAYCSKSDTAKAGGVRVVEGADNCKAQGQRTDLVEIKRMIVEEGMRIKDIMLEYPQLYCQYKNGLKDICDAVHGKQRCFKSHVSVFYGDSGTGKSLAAMGADDVYVLRCSKTGVWFDGYDYNKTLVIDDFYGWIPFNMMLHMLDRYAMRVDIKGGAMEFNTPNIIITSNKSPLDWYPSLSAEHQVALLRRLDCVVRYDRTRGALDVTKQLDRKITALKGSSGECEDVDELMEMYESDAMVGSLTLAVPATPVEATPPVQAAPVEATPPVQATPAGATPLCSLTLAVPATPVEATPPVQAAPVEATPPVQATPAEPSGVSMGAQRTQKVQNGTKVVKVILSLTTGSCAGEEESFVRLRRRSTGAWVPRDHVPRVTIERKPGDGWKRRALVDCPIKYNARVGDGNGVVFSLNGIPVWYHNYTTGIGARVKAPCSDEEFVDDITPPQTEDDEYWGTLTECKRWC